jgi:hypothetical protein
VPAATLSGNSPATFAVPDQRSRSDRTPKLRAAALCELVGYPDLDEGRPVLGRNPLADVSNGLEVRIVKRLRGSLSARESRPAGEGV